MASFDPKFLKMDKKSLKNIDIGYIIVKDFDYVKIKSVNLLYLTISEADGCFEEENENEFLILDSTDKNKKVFKKMQNSGVELKVKL